MPHSKTAGTMEQQPLLEPSPSTEIRLADIDFNSEIKGDKLTALAQRLANPNLRSVRPLNPHILHTQLTDMLEDYRRLVMKFAILQQKFAIVSALEKAGSENKSLNHPSEDFIGFVLARDNLREHQLDVEPSAEYTQNLPQSNLALTNSKNDAINFIKNFFASLCNDLTKYETTSVKGKIETDVLLTEEELYDEKTVLEEGSAKAALRNILAPINRSLLDEQLVIDQYQRMIVKITSLLFRFFASPSNEKDNLDQLKEEQESLQKELCTTDENLAKLRTCINSLFKIFLFLINEQENTTSSNYLLVEVSENQFERMTPLHLVLYSNDREERISRADEQEIINFLKEYPRPIDFFSVDTRQQTVLSLGCKSTNSRKIMDTTFEVASKFLIEFDPLKNVPETVDKDMFDPLKPTFNVLQDLLRMLHPYFQKLSKKLTWPVFVKNFLDSMGFYYAPERRDHVVEITLSLQLAICEARTRDLVKTIFRLQGSTTRTKGKLYGEIISETLTKLAEYRSDTKIKNLMNLLEFVLDEPDQGAFLVDAVKENEKLTKENEALAQQNQQQEAQLAQAARLLEEAQRQLAEARAQLGAAQGGVSHPAQASPSPSLAQMSLLANANNRQEPPDVTEPPPGHDYTSAPSS